MNRTDRWAAALSLVGAALLASCGGSGGDGPQSAVSDPLGEGPGCTVPEKRQWMSGQFRDAYLWNSITPAVDPLPDRSLQEYFSASLFKGNERLPADRFSYFQTTEAFTQFFQEGQTLAYGFAVAGQEVMGRSDAPPLYIRDVTPGSPAALAGLARGDRVVSLNGVPAADLVARSDFAALTPAREGDVLQMEVERGGSTRSARVVANVHAVVPLRYGKVLSLPDGRKVGVVRVNTMISLLEADLAAQFRLFIGEQISELIIDLRYNGGGLVSVGRTLASMAAGRKADSQVYALLRHNTQQQSRNQSFLFSDPLGWQGLSRVYVLVGSRTCSASEQVISGLQGVGVDVVVVGSTTCGKPVGFRPVDHCGRTFSIVNFESVNAQGRGDYYNGVVPRCVVAENFTVAMEDPRDSLTAAALQHARSGACPAGVGAERVLPLAERRQRATLVDGPDVRGVMTP